MHRSTAVAFLNHKGGVGKTTSVVNTGAGLAILGKRVLIVDLDPQGHLTSFLGIEANEIDTSIYGVLLGERRPRDAIITKTLNARLCINGHESRLKLSVIPSSLELAEADMAFANMPGREFLLKKSLAEIGEDFDYILLDCAPSLGLTCVNALAASRKVFIPVQTEYLALRSLENLLKKIDFVIAELNLDLVLGGLIAT